MNAAAPAWAELFPDEDFQFRFGLRPAEAAAFFAPTPGQAGILRERSHWLASDPDIYSALLPEGEPIVAELAALAQTWNPVAHLAALQTAAQPHEWLLQLGKSLEPDFLLLHAEENGPFRLVAGCLCFPSSWALAEKAGRPVLEIHAPVPTLNATLGSGIDQFLGRIRPAAAWSRSNWGLSRSGALNQHPCRRTPALAPPLHSEEVWLRIENQIFYRLPQTGGLLFGIRIQNVPLAEVKAWPAAARGLGRALRTMPAEVARYKGLTAAREAIAALL